MRQTLQEDRDICRMVLFKNCAGLDKLHHQIIDRPNDLSAPPVVGLMMPVLHMSNRRI